MKKDMVQTMLGCGIMVVFAAMTVGAIAAVVYLLMVIAGA